jgi:peroxiredoxin Q/BCP
MRRLRVLSLLGLTLAFGGPKVASGQEGQDFLSVGEMAPDVQVTGATRHGVLTESVSLSDLRGETVVLAFFFKARTGG